ncbi:MAG: hypothetical protein IH851_08285 [Armatimonadetes bacterium]|nr:hypothetical protein [Armatimonadota bacterium]
MEGGGGFDGIGFGINTMYGNQSMVAAFLPFREQNTRVYFQDFGVNFDTSVWGQNFALELGRFGYQTGAYFFQRIDNTPYFVNDRWDNGNWYMDGGLVSFDWGAANLDVWAGRNSERFDSGENIVFGSAFHNDIWPMTAGPQGFLADGLVMIDQSLGFNLDFGLGDNGDLMLTYMFLDSNTIVPDPVSGADVNRVVVFGGELEYSLNDNLHLYGGYSQSDLMENSSSVLTDDNSAWWAELGWYQDSWEAMLGYREIQPYFGAPGDWGRVGFLWNPVDIQGFFAMLAFLDKPNVNLGAYFYEGATGMILGTDDTIVGYTADVTWCAGGPWEFLLGWERVEYDFAGTPFFGAADDNVVNWYRIGFNYSPGGDQALRFLYEISDYDDGPGGGILGSDFRGGLITTQWSVKF